MENGLLMDPENVSARRYLAQMYVQNNSPWMAIFTLEEGLRHNKGKGDLNLDLGQIYFNQKRYDEAFECYMKAWLAGSSQGRLDILCHSNHTVYTSLPCQSWEVPSDHYVFGMRRILI